MLKRKVILIIIIILLLPFILPLLEIIIKCIVNFGRMFGSNMRFIEEGICIK